MIVVFAGKYDASATSLATRWKAHNASLLTCDDLSLAGWRHYVSSPEASTAVVGGCVIAVEEITGVLIRWPGVFAPELTQIAVADRDYVAGEMMAFLVSWLSSLPCPVVNRPTPLNLAGPAWRREQWTYAAAQLGIPVSRVHRHVVNSPDGGSGDEPPTHSARVTVVGDRCFGTDDETLRSQARRLARAAEVRLLEVSFNGPERESCFAAADLFPDISAQVADAVLDLLLARR